MKKKLIRISFYILLAALFIFLEWQISDTQQELNNEPKAHIAVGRWLNVKDSYIDSCISYNIRNFIYSSLLKYARFWRYRRKGKGGEIIEAW